MDHIAILTIPNDAGHKGLVTFGASPCIVYCAEGKNSDGEVVLGMYHSTGAQSNFKSNDTENIKNFCRAELARLQYSMREAGCSKHDIVFIGGQNGETSSVPEQTAILDLVMDETSRKELGILDYAFKFNIAKGEQSIDIYARPNKKIEYFLNLNEELVEENNLTFFSNQSKKPKCKAPFDEEGHKRNQFSK